MKAWLGGIRIADSSPACHNLQGCTQDEVYMVTFSRAHELFEYRDGELYWKKSRGSAKAGNVAGLVQIQKRKNHKDISYKRVGIDKKLYQVHNVIFLMEKGYIPEYPDVVDHIDGNGLNNNICNLRHATSSQNAMNRSIRNDNSSGVVGVSWNSREKKFLACISINKKLKVLGYFNKKEEAIKARKSAEEKYYAEFAKTNF